MEEHVEQLLAELQKKNRILQAYVLTIEPGALVSEQSDIHKVRTLFFCTVFFFKLETYLLLLEKKTRKLYR